MKTNEYQMPELSPIDRQYIDKTRKKYRTVLEIPPELLEGLARGADSAFDGLYVHFFDPLFDFINSIVRNEEDAKEIIQDTFTDLWVKRDSLNTSKNIKSLIYTCARNNAFDYFKRRKVVERYHALTDANFNDEPSPENALIARDLELWIRMAVENMPKQRKTVFIMNREDDMSIDEIAAALNISVSVVKKHLVAARKDIRKILPFIVLFLLSQ